MPNETQEMDGLDKSNKAVNRRAWPVEEGRYKVGNPDSPVAVCTMASVELELPLDKIAISGKCVTENLGIEKIVRNVIANPKIRFIILCGKDSHGHFVGQAIKSLIENGVDEEKRIIGAKGAMPVLKNLKTEEIERFRKQIEPVDLTGETDTAKILAGVNELFERNPGPLKDSLDQLNKAVHPEFEGGKMKIEERLMETRAEAHPINEWVKDSKGFFTIHPNPERKEIIVEHHDSDGRTTRKIVGESAEDLYHHIIKLGLLSRYDHAAYLGRELAKAEFTIRNQLGYEQDADLKTPEQNKEPVISKPVPSKPEETKVRFLTYIKGLREIPLEDVTKPDREFRNLLRERGLSRVF